jgi:hypothetical protein
MDYFGSVERELSRALRRRADRRWRSPLRSRNPRLLIALATCTVTVGTALAATGVIPLGAPVHVPRGLNPRAGSGVPAPGGSAVLPLTYADPEGGPPWGMRVVRTTRGLVCVQIARVQNGQLGVLGIDGAFHDDGRFHPLPASALPHAGGARGLEALAPNTTCSLPTQPFAGDRLGVARGGGGPLDTTHVPRGRLRDLHYGMLGAEALSVSYSLGGRTQTEAVVPVLGAYLIVTPTTPTDALATAGGSFGSIGGLGPVSPLTSISYRLGGKLCERGLPGRHAAHPCPPPQSLYGPSARPAAPLHRPIQVTLKISHRRIRGAVVRFRAPFAVPSAGQSYEVRASIGRCHGSIGGYTGTFTDRDIGRGELVSQSIGDPFDNTCGGRAVKIGVFYAAAGYPPREVGSVRVVEPPGTRPAPLPGPFAHRLRKRTEHAPARPARTAR